MSQRIGYLYKRSLPDRLLKQPIKKLLLKILGGDNLKLYKNLFYYRPIQHKAKESSVVVLYKKHLMCGLADRLDGMVSCYMLALQYNRAIKIYHTYDFNIEKYLEPNEVDWRIKPEDISYGLNESRPIINGLYGWRLIKKGFPILNPKMKQYHVYGVYNVEKWLPPDKPWKGDSWGVLYNRLFKPTAYLQNMLDSVKREVGIEQAYLAVHIRFLNYLENVEFEKEDTIYTTEEQKQEKIRKCLAKIHEIHLEHPDKVILVFSDSNRFLSETMPEYVRLLPGKVGHVGIKKGDQLVDKAFIDLYTMAGADLIYNIVDDDLHTSGFSMYAAKIGGKTYIRTTLT